MRLWSLRNRVARINKERYEAVEDLKGFELLTYFEGPVIQQAIKGRDVFEALKAFIRVWKSEPQQYVLPL